MGAAEWNARSAYYDGLSLRTEGDDLEQIAAKEHNVETEFPNYTRFWKLNIVPSSPRPQKRFGFRPGGHVALRYMSQTSYSVLHNFVQGKRLAGLLHAKDYGFYLANIQSLLLFAGNGLQLLSELEDVIVSHLAPLLPGFPVSALPGGRRTLFHDWAANWNPRRELIVNYRNYLTHRGLMMVFYRKVGGVREPFVLSRNALVARGGNPTAWAYVSDGIDPNSPDLVRFDETAIQILADTIAYTNDAYGRICDCLEPFHTNDQYQNAWGWAAGLPVIPAA